MEDDTDLTRQLLQAGTDVHAVQGENSDTLLHIAARNGNNDIVQVRSYHSHKLQKAHSLFSIWTMGSSPGELSEELVMYEKQKKCWKMNCDVGEATEGLENELWHR